MSYKALLAGSLVIGGVLACASFFAPLEAKVALQEPIVPIPSPPAADPRKVALGELLFSDKRLSRSNTRSCASCHDLTTNGAGRSAHDLAWNGSPLPLNTTTVFNAALSFRLGWRGEFRTLDEQIVSLMSAQRIMGIALEQSVGKLAADPAVARQFREVYGRGPDVLSVIDVLATFEQTLVTPSSRFDRWLAGDAVALTAREKSGYALFKSLGCISCHQGVNVGGNMFQRQGVFAPLVRGEPVVVRVPSLRNVAVTPPYFHDGSAETLQEAVRRMGTAQLNARLTEKEIESLVSFLNTLTGEYRGQPLRQ